MSESILRHYCHFPQSDKVYLAMSITLLLLDPSTLWYLQYPILGRLCICYSSRLIFVLSLNFMVWVKFIYGTSFFTNSLTIFQTQKFSTHSILKQLQKSVFTLFKNNALTKFHKLKSNWLP